MRIIFMGTPEFALPSLKILLEHSYDIAAVVTSPDKPQGRGQKLTFSPVKELAIARNLRLLQPESLKAPDFVSSIAHLQPTLIVVVAFRILPREVFIIPTAGSINLHASLLPRYRGAAPINWAIINGERETGVTTFFLQEKVDTGSIILQARASIGADETAGELHDRLAELGAEIVLRTVRQIELGTVRTQMQDETYATPAPKIFKENCLVDWRKSAQQLHNFVRGLSPYPCAWTTHKGKTLRIFRTQPLADEPAPAQAAPGTVIEVRNTCLHVHTGAGVISLVEIQLEGRKRMGIAEFLRGHHVEVGDQLG
ncbi:MAG: methionyl-tRNA formyltransferase [Ignavibacteria bacterium]|nr:methionyl-tRNA formyltransferase [Ignavibacteria bacterium]